MEIGTRIVIAAPTILFLATFFWAYLFHGHLEDQISEIAVKDLREDTISTIVGSDFLRAIFAEAIIVFAVNGLILIFELSEISLGSVLLLAGIICAITGLIITFTMERKGVEAMRKTVMSFFAVTLALATGEFSYFVSYGSGYEAVFLTLVTIISGALLLKYFHIP